jgi:phenylacetate-coenzyme A ligase PaaK-like adenylate-forming protein
MVDAMQPPFDPWASAVAAAEVAAVARESRTALAERQSRRVAALLESALRRSPRYRRLLEGRHAPPQLADMPVARKAELMRDFDHWCTDPRIRLEDVRRFVAEPANIAEPYLGDYVVWESSGSSGEPAVFVQDAAAMAVYDALESLRRPDPQPWSRLFDPWAFAEKIVFVGATAGHFASTVSIERLRRLNPFLRNSISSLSFLQPLETLVKALDREAATVVATYPSVAVLLAHEFVAGRLAKPPREVWTGGETLSPAVRAFIQCSLGCRVVNSYGASEFLTLASECRCGVMHFNSDWAVLEPVDAKGRPVPPGTAGETTLLTNLANHVQPLIRYDLGDQVTLRDEPCACGSPLPVVDVRGRCDEPLRVSARSGGELSIVPLAICTVLEEEAGLFDFQVIQQRPGELSLSTPERGIEGRRRLQRAREALDAFLSGQGAGHVRIHCSNGRAPRRSRSGKLQRIVSSCNRAWLDPQR